MRFKNTLLPIQTMLQSGGRLLDLSTPAIMGILNATPDSFYNKGLESNREELLLVAGKMVADGAAILDIGGVSTRPGAQMISEAEELDRIMPVIEILRKSFPDQWLSVDTFRAQVARQAVSAGVDIINDISSGTLDEAMIAAVASLKAPYIAMHMQGTPANMQDNPTYTNVVSEIIDYLANKVLQCARAGITDIIIDPGFGFGKTVQHNFALLNDLQALRIIEKPIMAGLSRKSMICKPLKVSPANALNGTTALHMVALAQGASILRVHDVKEAMQCILLHQQLNN
ncbi:MAG: dihydropteroate synthase [Taibaiella sp.]|nr:dihydropteroate synthase [Taibaiella sp.]